MMKKGTVPSSDSFLILSTNRYTNPAFFGFGNAKIDKNLELPKFYVENYENYEYFREYGGFGEYSGKTPASLRLYIRKGHGTLRSLCLSFPWQKLLLTVLVSLVEFVDASGGVNELDFTGVEWVRGVGDLDLYNRILNSVNNESLFCLRA